MMGNLNLKLLWKKLMSLSLWYFVSLFVIIGAVAIYSLRDNNQNMVKLRNAVFTADKNSGDVTAALHNLQSYVYGHMNTNLASGPNPVYPPIQLNYTYNRLVQTEQQRVADINAGVYTAAQAYCQSLYPASFSGGPRVPCIETYVQSHGTSANPIPASLYKFDFISPAWTPDLAGWSLVAWAASLVLLMFVIFKRRIWHKKASIKLKLPSKKT